MLDSEVTQDEFQHKLEELQDEQQSELEQGQTNSVSMCNPRYRKKNETGIDESIRVKSIHLFLHFWRNSVLAKLWPFKWYQSVITKTRSLLGDMGILKIFVPILH